MTHYLFFWNSYIPIIDIKALDMNGYGIGHLINEDGTPGKVIFVEDALPGERVSFQTVRNKPQWEAAVMTHLHRESAARVQPRCAYFGICGGCVLQHLDAAAQIAIKQKVLEDTLWHVGKLKAENSLRPIHGPNWNYRYRARLAVRHVVKKSTVLVGFHERKSSFVADMRSCEVLPPHVSAMLLPLRHLIGSLSIVNHVPQIELAIGFDEHGQTITALVLRVLEPLSAADQMQLKAFADCYHVAWWLQPTGPETASAFYPTQSSLRYTLPEFGITLLFKPTDFIQVNHQMNQVLVTKALRLLAIEPQDRVADLFCGLGNFSLPIATKAQAVVGIEGSAALTQRAADNAK